MLHITRFEHPNPPLPIKRFSRLGCSNSVWCSILTLVSPLIRPRTAIHSKLSNKM